MASHSNWLPFITDSPSNPDDSAATEREDSTAEIGSDHAVQDHRPRTSGAESGTARDTSEQSDSAGNARFARQPACDPPPDLGTSDREREAGQAPAENRQRSIGTGRRGDEDLFGDRVASASNPPSLPRRRDGLRPASHAARVGP